MPRRTLEDRLHLVLSVALVLAVGGVFWLPALLATGGDWPAPLDDVFIHFDFARSIAEGDPFQWIAGQGFSSGETSPLYAWVLAFGYAVGFRGLWLGVWAGLIATFMLVSLLRSVRELVQPAPWYASWLGGAMLVGVGVLDWSWFSGMEVALFGGVLGRALVAVKRAREAAPDVRRRRQWRVGLWGAALVATRPEAAVLVALFAVATARRAGAGSALAAILRVAVPGALVTLAGMGVNQAFTGDAMSAGAVLKLLSKNPFMTDVDRARELVVNLFHVRFKILEAELSAWPHGWLIFPALATVGLVSRRTRGLSATCLLGAIAWCLVVSWNGAARYQNYRYYAPALALLMVAAALGLGVRSRVRWVGVLAPLAALFGIGLAAPRVLAQARHFRAASKNIHDQQVEVGRRLATRMPEGAIVLVGDAGAIPYFSRHAAIDALGLGGFHGVPFVRAANSGEAATVELIERLAPEQRPSYLALYPNWFALITGSFGREVDRVTIEGNVICGGPTKGIYLADWSALGGADRRAPGVVDTLDVADVVSEEAHAYVSPAPSGGWTALHIAREGARERLFDGGRIIPEGRTERFRLTAENARASAVSMRVGKDAGDVELVVVRPSGAASAPVRLVAEPRGPDEWPTLHAELEGGAVTGDTLVLRAVRGEYRDFHVWLLDSGARARFE